MRFKTLVVLVLCLAAPMQFLAADTQAPPAPAALAEVLEGAYPDGAPGAAAIVVHDGEVLFRGAVGMADLEHEVPLTPEMIFRLGSITKQFTAAAILMLAEREKLSLDAKLSTFLPDYPEHAADVTVEHLLTHVSGIVSYTGIPGHMATEIGRDLTVDELVAVFKDLPLEFAPGERFAYNNSGYVLLGAIIEKVSGKTYEEFIESEIFEPLGMKDSHYGSFTRVIKNRVRGYMGRPGAYENARYLSMTQPYAAGSLLSTVDDLVRWNAALFDGKVINKESLAKMTKPYALAGGDETGYGYGLAVGAIRDETAISHGGGIFGFTTYGTYLPDHDLYVAVLSNNTAGDANTGRLGQQLVAEAIGKPFRRFERADVAPEVLEGYVGVYQINDEDQRVVSFAEGKLFTKRTGGQKLEAVPAGDDLFFYERTFSWFKFDKGEDGALSMMMHQDGNEEAEAALRVSTEIPTRAAIEVDPAIFEELVGEYELRPGFVLAVFIEDEALMAQATGQNKVRLWPESETRYFLKVVDAELEFVRDDKGQVTEAILHQGGRSMPAKRK